MEAGKHYHICTHANGFENLFQSAENYRYFLKRYEHFISPVADKSSNLQGFENLGGLKYRVF